MNKLIRLLLVTLSGLFLFYFTAHSQCTGNLLTNPGFESGLTGWTTVGNVSITTDAHSGTKAANVSGSGFASIGQALPATVGTSYTVKVWSKGNFLFELRFMNASWAKIPGGNTIGFSSTNYQENSITATAPPGAVYVYWLASKDLSNGFKVDDACLVSGGGGPTCAITPTISNIACNNNNTPNNPNDDVYSFLVNASNPAGGAGFQMVIPQLSQTYNGTYGSQLLIQNIPVSAGNLTLNFMDNMTANCSATTTVTAPPPCSVSGLPELNGILHEDIPAENGCYTPPGQNYLVYSMQIRNTGSVAAGAFKVKFYFSLDNTLSANDVLWSTVNVPSLNTMSNGGPVFIGPNQPVPASLAPNVYYVIVVIDADNQVTESNEANNVIPPSPVNIGAPDLSLESYSGLPNTVAAGSSFPVQVTLKYLSNGFPQPASTGFAAQIFLADVTPPVLVGSTNYTVGDFAQASTVTKTVTVNLPANTAIGSRYFHITAEYNFCQNPSNNSQYQTVNVTAPAGSQIDLELTMVQNTTNPVIYSHYTTTLTLLNKGPQAASGVKVKWMKPAGVVYTGGNEFVASQGSFNPNGDQVWTVGSVPANGTATLKVSYFLLQNGAPITYAQVSAATETDMDSQPNNGTPPTPNQDDEAATGAVSGNLPDLIGLAQEVIPGTNNCFTNPGSSFVYYSMMVHNYGTVAAGAFKVKFYFSTDNVLSSNDVFWVTRTVPSLAINGSSGYSPAFLNVTEPVPGTLAKGTYYIIMHVDADNEVAESNEGNQFFGQLVNIGAPNVVLNSFTGLPSTYSPGSSFNLNVLMSYAANSFPSSFLTGNAEVQVTVAQSGQSPITVGTTTFPASELVTGSLGKNVAVSLPTNLALGNYVLQVRVNTSFCEQLILDNTSNQNISVTASGNPCAAITITPAPGQITIAGAVAPHVLIKVFNPNWTLNFQCLDNCANPLVISGLGTGTYHVQVKLITSGWGDICYLERDVNLSSFAGGNVSGIAKQDDRLRISFEKFYPNPSAYQVFVDLFSPKEQSATLDIYDQQGHLVHTMRAELEAGVNTLDVMVMDWKSGTYNVIARGEETGLPAYGRFLKVWEE